MHSPTTEATIAPRNSPDEDQLRQWLESPAMVRQLSKAYRGTVSGETFARMALTVAKKNSGLMRAALADPRSFAAALIECAQAGLEPDAVRGEAYLVPYSGKVQLVVGYRGLIQLAYRSGQISSFDPFAVYERDEFKVTYGTDKKITHVPYEKEDRGELRATYAVVYLINGDRPVTQLKWRHEIDAIKDKSLAKMKNPDASPWVQFYEAMAIKTACKAVCKFIPSSPVLQRLVSLDDQADAQMTQSLIDIEADPSEPVTISSRTSALADDLKKNKPTPAKKKATPTAASKVTEPTPDAVGGQPEQQDSEVAALRTTIKQAVLEMETVQRRSWMKNVGLVGLTDLDGLDGAALAQIKESLP